MWRRRSLVQLGGAWALTLLLLVPLVYAGHHHDAEQTAAGDSCATCTATHATYTPPTAPVLAASVEISQRPVSRTSVPVVQQLDQDDHHGRAPPHVSADRPC
jgi:hypothetical protein